MIEKIVYFGLTIILGYLYFELEKRLRDRYFISGSEAHYFAGIFVFFVLINPKSYFRRKTFLRGYFLYVLHLILIFASVYFFLKLIGVL